MLKVMQDNCMLELVLDSSDRVQQHSPQDNTEYDVATSQRNLYRSSASLHTTNIYIIKIQNTYLYTCVMYSYLQY